MTTDPAFVHRAYFTSIRSLSWEESIALQPADLVAYEVFKEAERRLTKPNRDTSKALLAMLDLPSFGIRSRTLDKKMLVEIKATMSRQGLPPREEKDVVRVLFRRPSDAVIAVHKHHNFTYISGD